MPDQQNTDPLFDTDEPPFVVYAMADGSQIFGEYEFVTGTEWWDDRDEEEVRLIKRTYRLISEEEIVLPIRSRSRTTMPEHTAPRRQTLQPRHNVETITETCAAWAQLKRGTGWILVPPRLAHALDALLKEHMQA
jgi:hypothetical protein